MWRPIEKRTQTAILQIHLSFWEIPPGSRNLFSKCLFCLGTSISKVSSTILAEACSSISTVEVGTVSEKPQAPAALSELARNTGKGVLLSYFFRLQLPEFSDRSSKIFFSVFQKKAISGTGLGNDAPQRCASQKGWQLAGGDEPPSSLQASVEDDYPRNQFGRQTLRRTHNPASHRRAPVARALSEVGVAWPARRSQARRGGGVPPAWPAAARFRRAPRVSRTSCGLARTPAAMLIVRPLPPLPPPPLPPKGRLGEELGVSAQSPECEDNTIRPEPTPAGTGRASFAAARRRLLPWPPPCAGGAARCYASDSPPPAPGFQARSSARPLARGDGPGLPKFPPASWAPASSSRRRRGGSPTWGPCCSPPQENESLFTFLGKKCVVVCETRIAAPDLSLPGPGGSAGRWSGKEAGAARGESDCWPGLSLTPAPWVRAVRGRRPPRTCPGAGKCQVRRPVLGPARSDPGPCLCCWFRLCCQASRGSL